MIGVVDVEIQAKYPSMPLDPMQAYANSPSSIRLRNVPKRIGDWCIRSVNVTAAYPDGSIKSADCVLVGGVWVGTIEGTSTTGRTEKGYTVYASGTDENGNAVNGYVLGKGDIEILESDGTVVPGKSLAYVHLLSADSVGEKDGDLWRDLSGTWRIQQDGEAWLIGDDSGAIAQVSAALAYKRDLNDLGIYVDPAVGHTPITVKVYHTEDIVTEYKLTWNESGSEWVFDGTGTDLHVR